MIFELKMTQSRVRGRPSQAEPTESTKSKRQKAASHSQEAKRETNVTGIYLEDNSST